MLRKMGDRVWAALGKRYKIRRHTPDTWQARRINGTHDLPKSANFEQISSRTVCDALDDLLGRGNWQRPERWGSLLVSFPEAQSRWDVPHQSWHLDFPASQLTEGTFAVRLFTCLAKLEPGGGGTVFVAGSHRIVQNLVRTNGIVQLHSAEVRKTLIRQNPWIKALCLCDEEVDRARLFMNDGAVVNGIEVRVVEMTGEPGDVLLTHPLILHAPAKNCATFPRMVLSSTVYRAGTAPGSYTSRLAQARS